MRTSVKTILLTFVAVSVLFCTLSEESDGSSSATADTSDGEVYNISFGGWRYFQTVVGATYYLPTSDELGMDTTSTGPLIGWKCGNVTYKIGTEMTVGKESVVSGSNTVSYSPVYYTENKNIPVEIVYDTTDWTKEFSRTLDVGLTSTEEFTVTAKSLAGNTVSTASGKGETSYSSSGSGWIASEKISLTADLGTYLITIESVYTTITFESWHTSMGAAGVTKVPHEYTFTNTFVVTFAVSSHHKPVVISLDDTVSEYIIGQTVSLPKAGTGSVSENLAWWSNTESTIQYLPGYGFPAEKSMTLKSVLREDGQGVIAYVFGEGATSDTVKRAYIFEIDGEVKLPSDITRTDDGQTYKLAGWRESSGSVLYLPGTVLGKNTGTANTSQDYVEMWAVWILDSDTHHRVTFQTAAGYSVSSEYVPDGYSVYVPTYGSVPRWASDENGTVSYSAGSVMVAKSDLTLTARVKVTVLSGSDILDILYPLYGSDFVLDTSLAAFDGYTFDITEKENIVSDLLIHASDGSDPVPTPEPETTFQVTYIVDKNATVEYSTKVFTKGDKLVFPKTDLAYCTLSQWQSSGTQVDTNTEVISNMTITAVFVKLFSTTTNGCTVTVIPEVSGNYSVDWGDDTSGATQSQNDVSHTYAAGTSGKITVTFSTGKYVGASAWARYSVEGGSSIAGTITVKIDGVEMSMKAGSKVSDIPVKDENGSFKGWFSDQEHTQAVSFDTALVNGTELWSLFEEEPVLDFSDPVVIAVIACIAVLGIFAIRRFI